MHFEALLSCLQEPEVSESCPIQNLIIVTLLKRDIKMRMEGQIEIASVLCFQLMFSIQ